MQNKYKFIKRIIEMKFQGKIENHIIILFIYLFLNFIIASNLAGDSSFSFIDLYVWHMGYSQHILFHGIFILFFIHRIIEKQKYDVYFYSKYRNRNSLFKYKVLLIFLINLFYIFLTLIICLLQSLNKNCFDIKWSKFSTQFWGLIKNYDSSSYLVDYAVSFLLNMILFLFTLSLLYFLLTLIISKKISPILVLTIIEVADYSIYLNRLKVISKYTFLGNLMLGYNENKLNTTVNWSFWLPAIILLLIMCYISFQQIDLMRYSK